MLHVRFWYVELALMLVLLTCGWPCLRGYDSWIKCLAQGYFYYIFGFLFLVGILTVIITIEVSIVCTYVQLCAEDYLWW